MNYTRTLLVLVMACGGATAETSEATTLPDQPAQAAGPHNGWPSAARVTWANYEAPPTCPETSQAAHNGARACSSDEGAVFCVPAEVAAEPQRCFAVSASEASFGIQSFERIEASRVWFVQALSSGGPGWQVTERTLMMAEVRDDGLAIVSAMPLGRMTLDDESEVQEELRYAVEWQDYCAVVVEAAHTCLPADAEGCPSEMRAAPSVLNGDVPPYDSTVTAPLTNFVARWGLQSDGTWVVGGC